MNFFIVKTPLHHESILELQKNANSYTDDEIFNTNTSKKRETLSEILVLLDKAYDLTINLSSPTSENGFPLTRSDCYSNLSELNFEQTEVKPKQNLVSCLRDRDILLYIEAVALSFVSLCSAYLLLTLQQDMYSQNILPLRYFILPNIMYDNILDIFEYYNDIMLRLLSLWLSNMCFCDTSILAANLCFTFSSNNGFVGIKLIAVW